MTSDAKVGLLLGLVFIVVIAFLMNGLPTLLSRETAHEATTTTRTANRGVLRLDAQAQNAIQRVRDEMVDLPFPPRRFNMEENRQRDRRFAATGKTVTNSRIPKNFKPSKKNQQNSKVRTYTVKDGDNLAKIAKNVFGDDLGNKYATIQKIFDANKDTMNTPDQLSVGQKLRIPSLHSQDKTLAARSMESTGMFDKIKGSFSNLVKSKPAKKQAKVYVVKDGDSLWKIAEKLFSDGNRFVDIAKLNRNLISDGETLSIGMKLKLPK